MFIPKEFFKRVTIFIHVHVNVVMGRHSRRCDDTFSHEGSRRVVVLTVLYCSVPCSVWIHVGLSLLKSDCGHGCFLTHSNIVFSSI